MNDRRVLKLTPEQFRLFVMATAWSVTNRTDGVIETVDLQLVPFATAADAGVLVGAGLWNRTDLGWLIVEYSDTQTSSAQLDQLNETRRRDRERKARARKTKTGGPAQVRPEVPAEVPAEVRPEVHPENTGKDRKARTGLIPEQYPEPSKPEANLWDEGFPQCKAGGCNAQLTHETQLPSGLCPQHFGNQLMTKGN